MAFESSSIFAPVFSQRAKRLLMEDIRLSQHALDASLASSEDQTLVVNIFSFGIQLGIRCQLMP
jgi:hypothetical protein